MPDLTYAKNKAHLSRVIDISRVTLDAWLRLPNAPKPLSNGTYVISEWVKFKASRGQEQDKPIEEIAALKLRNLKQKVELDDIKILKLAGDLVPIEWAKQLVAHLAISARNVVQESDITPEQKLKITERLEKIDFENFLSQLRNQAEEDVVDESGESENGVEEGSPS